MKGRTIVLDHIQGREAAALMVDGKLDDFLIATGFEAITFSDSIFDNLSTPIG